jgi:hypothetical protein
MELIAASRIVKAQARMTAARPYADELTRALAALGKNASLQHPMLTGVENPRRAGILLITSDRGLAGGYNANCDQGGQRAGRSARRRGQGGRAVRHRPQGRDLLPLPAHPGVRQLDRLLRAAELRRRAGRHRGGRWRR